MTNEIDTSNTVGPGQGTLFPWKLYEMLDGAETHGYTSIVSWSPDGVSFKVHDKETFVTYMSKYFKQTKYKSFQRQLNMWGFQRHLHGPAKGGYTHPFLVRGKPSMCSRMRRLKKSRKKSTTTTKSCVKRNRPIQGSKMNSSSNTTALALTPIQVISCSVVSQDESEASCSGDVSMSDEQFFHIEEDKTGKVCNSSPFSFPDTIQFLESSTRKSMTANYGDFALPICGGGDGIDEFGGRKFFPLTDFDDNALIQWVAL